MQHIDYAIVRPEPQEKMEQFFARALEDMLAFGVHVSELSGDNLHVLSPLPLATQSFAYSLVDATYDACERYLYYFAQRAQKTLVIHRV